MTDIDNQLVERQVKIIAKQKPLDKKELLDQAKLISEVLMAVMKPGIHYDVIPGTDKPSLMKAGAEMILMTFRIGVNYIVTDFSDRSNNMVGYRILVEGVHQPTGFIIGQGLGSCSTDEEKYKWRGAVCDEEFDAAGATNTRVKWGKGYGGKPAWSANQVRTNSADLDNTVLKMAKKRGLVDLALTSTAASQFFGQDLEDMPEELRSMYSSDFNKLKEKSDNNRSQPRTAGGNDDKPATEKQIGLIKSKLTNSGKDETVFLEHFKLDKLEDIKFGQVNAALEFFKQ